MPRVNLCRDPAADRREATRRIIRRGMAEQGVESQRDLAKSIGMKDSALSNRMCGTVPWDVDTMVKIFKKLRLTADDAAVILGVKK